MDLVSPEKRKEMLQNIETGFQEGQFNGEYELVSKDGQKIEYAGYGIRTNIDGNDYLVGFEIDISKQKKMEKDTHRLRNELAHVNRLATMGELTASIAHELNQPLAAIMSNAHAALQFLKKEIPDVDEIYAALTDITSDDQRASEIIKRLRKFLVKGQSENVRLNIADHVEGVVKLIKNDANNKNISIVFENTLPMLSLVMGDRIQLQQVVLNLILNAFEAMEEIKNESRKLVIRVIKNSDNRLTIEFIDNGIGFEQQDIEHLFTAFSTTKQEGMGMGLTISRTIIEAHGGQLKAIKNDNGGATFYFDLPLVSEISV
jgi:C4-dicarboxylate-specific signal transduction histidine kinase